MRTRVKICGITRPEDGRAAAELGADAIGLVFYPGSPRAVSVAQARAVISALPPFVTTVGLFVNAEATTVSGVLSQVPLDLLQFHGAETPEFCSAFGRPYIKAVGMREGIDPEAEAVRFAGASGLLVDAWDPERHGGTGTSFDWARLPDRLPLPVVLAGGLGPDNVAEAIGRVRPWAVDVSSGVEVAKGIKDHARMAAFMRGVESA